MWKAIIGGLLLGALLFGGGYLAGTRAGGAAYSERLSEAIRDRDTLRVANADLERLSLTLATELDGSRAEAGRLTILLDGAVQSLGEVGSGIAGAQGSAGEFDQINRDFRGILDGIRDRSAGKVE